VVNNTAKSFHPGTVVAAFCIGTRRSTDYIDGTPHVRVSSRRGLHPPRPLNIAKHKMVAINSQEHHDAADSDIKQRRSA